MKYDAYEPIHFSDVQSQAKKAAFEIRNNLDTLIDLLLEYESHEVALDEIDRTLDLLDNLEENADYFKLRIGAITTFLPRNQPLYALACFVLVPSLMASEVHYRLPRNLQELLPKIINLLKLPILFPNVIVSKKERLEFLKERSAIRTNGAGESYPVTDVVIFTGTPTRADKLRLVFDNRTLFITNGAGHNPIVVAANGDVEKAVDATLKLTLYNQGQDCAAPNSILVHGDCYQLFIDQLRLKIRAVKIGNYRDPGVQVGPISNADDLLQIQSILIENHSWLDPETPGVFRTREKVVEPTIVCKPLAEGGNYTESFAPILFIQKYDADETLSLYFDTDQYKTHAMYVTLYGNSDFVQNLISGKADGISLHTKETFLHNIHLHEPGVERGTKQYGGFGVGASNLSFNGKIISKPTLPQRDIYEYIAEPLITSGQAQAHKSYLSSLKGLKERKVEKILKLQTTSSDIPVETTEFTEHIYYDSTKLKPGLRYVKIHKSEIYSLADKPNTQHVITLESKDISHIKALRTLVNDKKSLDFEEFKSTLYNIPKQVDATEKENAAFQLRFFKHVYRLLFHQDTGPRLTNFLFEIHPKQVDKLLDV